MRKLRKLQGKPTPRQNGAHSGARTGLDIGGLAQSIGYNVRRTDVYLREQFLRMLHDWHVRPAEYSILRLVEANPSATQAEIADMLYIKRQNMGPLVARLERLGWLQRGVDPNDRRRQSLLLTPTGSKRIAALAQAALAMDRELTRGWTDSDRRTFLKLLQRLYEA